MEWPMFGDVLRALGVPMRDDQHGAGASGAAAQAGRQRGGGADIFVGGGFDDILPGSSMSEYVKDYARQTGRPVQYVPNNRVGQVVNAIREANRDGGPVNVIGHSYGGPDAYNGVARANRMGMRVDNLITLDPVGGPGNKVVGQAQPGQWVNVHATASQPDRSDWVASMPFVAHKPSALPVAQATHRSELTLNHRDVEGMMRQSGARSVLDRSRQVPASPADAFSSFPTAQALQDNLPMMDWIQRREADVRGR
jgi:pimeloyl-ACP methyl ester carboxylesterase